MSRRKNRQPEMAANRVPQRVGDFQSLFPQTRTVRRHLGPGGVQEASNRPDGLVDVVLKGHARPNALALCPNRCRTWSFAEGPSTLCVLCAIKSAPQCKAGGGRCGWKPKWGSVGFVHEERAAPPWAKEGAGLQRWDDAVVRRSGQHVDGRAVPRNSCKVEGAGGRLRVPTATASRHVLGRRPDKIRPPKTDRWDSRGKITSSYPMLRTAGASHG